MSSLKVQSVYDNYPAELVTQGEMKDVIVSLWKEGVRRLVLSLFIFGLFNEWLNPLYRLIDDGQEKVLHLFTLLTAALLLIGCLRMPKWLYTPIPVLLIACSMYYFYGVGEGIHWFAGYGELMVQDVLEIIQSGRLYGISMESRALLLLIGWTLLVVSVQMLAMGRGSILLFFSVTLVYLWVLEIAGNLVITPGLIRSAAWGLGLQMLIFRYHLSSIAEPRPARVKVGGNRFKYMLIAGMVLGSCVVGSALLTSLLPVLPERKISWDQALQTLEQWKNGSQNAAHWNAYSTSGYAKDDSELGAPLKLRHDPYFTAVSAQSTYWRGESKMLYTGRGWTQPVSDTGQRMEKAVEIADEEPDKEAVKAASSSPEGAVNEDHKREIRQTVIFEQPQLVSRILPILGGGLPVRVNQVFSGEAVDHSVPATASYDDTANAVYIERLGRESKGVPSIWGYELTSRLQTYTEEELRNSKGSDPDEISRLFLQLPGSLPDRVRTLGVNLSRQGENRYEAVLEVMSYLKGNYKYSLDSIRPSQGKDFVDSFLFEQKSGYCDHFSTAMVVMLRSAGVPARWVKGFAPVEPVSEDGSRYVVTFADAHSWVEVYFSGIGWVPFDPTPGYEAVPAVAGVDTEIVKNGESVGTKIILYVKTALKSTAIVWSTWWNAVKGVWMSVLFIALGVGFILLLAILHRKTLVRKQRFRFRYMLLQLRRRFPDQNELLDAADVVWRELYLLHGTKPSSMTAREYVNHISRSKEEQMVLAGIEPFVGVWEKLYYGGIQLNRTQSIKFLKQCLDLAFPSR
ncbi:Protein-glutamine gamma-glutamyltransferase [compost metagenome]